MKLTPEQNDALAEFISAQQRELTLKLADLEHHAEDSFMSLAEAEQRMAGYRGEEISFTEASNRAARRFPEQYAIYRRSVTK